jgi:hypothetical protein
MHPKHPRHQPAIGLSDVYMQNMSDVYVICITMHAVRFPTIQECLRHTALIGKT